MKDFFIKKKIPTPKQYYNIRSIKKIKFPVVVKPVDMSGAKGVFLCANKDEVDKFYKKSKNIITIHLGNGCSMSAIKNGKSIENSLGFGPMNGLVMGTRSGDIDQSVIFFLMKNLNKSADEVTNLLNKTSGMKGLTGFSDLREISEKAENGNQNCKNALNLAGYRIRKYIGAYSAALNGLDAIVFTAAVLSL